MKPFDFPLLADENIQPDVVSFLKQENIDIMSVYASDLRGKSDNEILEFAETTGKVILTHDNDFGRLSMLENKAFVGILYLRPGHIRPDFTIQSLKAIQQETIDVKPPFIIVAERIQNEIKIRVRQF